MKDQSNYRAAVVMFTRAWRRRFFYIKAPEISYSASTFDNGIWTLIAAEGNEIEAFVTDNGKCVLTCEAEHYVCSPLPDSKGFVGQT